MTYIIIYHIYLVNIYSILYINDRIIINGKAIDTSILLQMLKLLYTIHILYILNMKVRKT